MLFINTLSWILNYTKSKRSSLQSSNLSKQIKWNWWNRKSDQMKSLKQNDDLNFIIAEVHSSVQFFLVFNNDQRGITRWLGVVQWATTSYLLVCWMILGLPVSNRSLVFCQNSKIPHECGKFFTVKPYRFFLFFSNFEIKMKANILNHCKTFQKEFSTF